MQPGCPPRSLPHWDPRCGREEAGEPAACSSAPVPVDSAHAAGAGDCADPALSACRGAPAHPVLTTGTGGGEAVSLCPPSHTHVDNTGAGGSSGVWPSPAQLVLGRVIAAPALPNSRTVWAPPSCLPSHVSLAVHPWCSGGAAGGACFSTAPLCSSLLLAGAGRDALAGTTPHVLKQREQLSHAAP